MRGAGETPPPRPAWPEILATALVAAAVVAGLAFLTRELEVLLLLGSFAASALIVFALHHAPWSFLVCPTLAGAATIVVVALFYHNLRRTAPWPKYWL